MNIAELDQAFYLFVLSMARISAAFVLMPYFSRATLSSAMIRNGVVASLSLVLYPVVEAGYQGQETLSWLTLGLLVKEIFLGLTLGFIANIPFWAIESVGFFIDNQRGSTMASSLNPLSGSEASPLGILFLQTWTAFFFISGTFLILLGVLYKSYSVWPIFDFYPRFNAGMATFFLHQLDLLSRLTVLVAAPVIIGMFLAEFGLALISRFAPQLNVFILSMPIKSAIATAILVVYIALIVRHFSEHGNAYTSYINPLFELFR